MSRRSPVTRPPLERLQWFHSAVSEGRSPTLAEYCARFEIDMRTAYRDTAFLRDRFGAPLKCDRKTRGYYYTEHRFSLPAVLLTEGELVPIFLGEKVLRQYAGSAYEAELRTAFEKLCRALPDAVTVDLGAFEEAVSFEAGPTRSVEVEVYRRVLEAIRDRRQLCIRYYAVSRDEEKERIVDPYHLHNQAGDWYLIAYDRGPHEMRDFALSRIRAVRPTGGGFVVRAEFDRSRYLANQFGGFRGAEPVEVVVWFDAYQARWMREKTWPGETGREPHDDGALTLRLTVTSLEGVLRWVLQYGSHAEALEPAELRERADEEIRKLAKLYGV